MSDWKVRHEGSPQSSEGLTYEEASFVLRTSPEIVRERSHRARLALTVSLDARPA